MCWARIGLSDWLLLSWKLQTHFLTFEHLTPFIKMAALMLSLPTMRIKHTCADWCHLMYHWRPNYLRKFDLCIQTPHNQHRWQREGTKILNRKGSLGQWHLLPSKWILDSLKVMRLLPYSVQSASDVWHHARCIVGNTTVSQSKTKHKPIAIFGAFWWLVHVEGAGVMGSLAIGNYLPLTLFAPHR